MGAAGVSKDVTIGGDRGRLGAGSRPAQAKLFLKDLDVASRAAARAAGGFEEVHLRVADQPLRLRFAGPSLLPIIMPAFSHLRDAPGSGEALTVRLWDSESTGAAMPPARWGGRAGSGSPLRYGTVPELSGGGVWTSLQWRTDALSVYDARRREAFYWARSADRLARYEGVAPLRSMLAVWLRDRGVELVHASAVGTPAGCALVVGKKGSGKSTTALACLDAGLSVLADDYCAIGPGAEPTVFSLFGTGKLHRDALERMPFLTRMARAEERESDDDKTLLFLDRGTLLSRAPLKLVLIPHITGETDSMTRPATASEALAALAPSSIVQLPEGSQSTLSRFASIVRGAACHHLEAGRDPAGVADQIRSLLSR